MSDPCVVQKKNGMKRNIMQTEETRAKRAIKKSLKAQEHEETLRQLSKVNGSRASSKILKRNSVSKNSKLDLSNEEEEAQSDFNNDSSNLKRHRKSPFESWQLDILKKWFLDNVDYPYLNEASK